MKISLLALRSFAALALSVVAALVAGCYADQGRMVKSDTGGFGQYTNRTLKVSALSPLDWKGNVGSNGVYMLVAPGKDGAQIFINSSPVERLLEEAGGPPDSTLEEYKAYRLAQIVPDQIGPELERSVEKTTLAGREAWEIRYSYRPVAGKGKMFVREIFTLAKGRVHFLWIYSLEPDDPDEQKVFETMKDSYRVI